MFPTLSLFGGVNWRKTLTMNRGQKQAHRMRMKAVDNVIATVAASGVRCNILDACLALPKESEMEPRDKYTVFSRKHKKYRKSIHHVPKWTKITHRINPIGF